MTELRIRIFLAVLAWQAILLIWALGLFRRGEPTRPLYRVLVLGVAQVLAIIMFYAGGELDSA